MDKLRGGCLALLEEGLLEDLKIDGSPVERLETMFRRRAAFVGTNSSVGRLIFSEQLVHLAGERGRLKVAGRRMRSMAFMLTALDEAKERGEVPSSIASAALAQVIQGVLLTFALRVNLGIPESPEQPVPYDIAERLWGAWMPGRAAAVPGRGRSGGEPRGRARQAHGAAGGLPGLPLALPRAPESAAGAVTAGGASPLTLQRGASGPRPPPPAGPGTPHLAMGCRLQP